MVSDLLATAPLLHALLLDACDLEGGGFSAEPEPYWALRGVHMARCSSRAGGAGGGLVAAAGDVTLPCVEEGAHAFCAVPVQRLYDKDVRYIELFH